jgi:hypothetical protein
LKQIADFWGNQNTKHLLDWLEGPSGKRNGRDKTRLFLLSLMRHRYETPWHLIVPMTTQSFQPYDFLLQTPTEPLVPVGPPSQRRLVGLRTNVHEFNANHCSLTWMIKDLHMCQQVGNWVTWWSPIGWSSSILLVW